MTIASPLAALFIAAPLLAQPQARPAAQPRPTPPPAQAAAASNAVLAKRAYDVASANLEAAKSYLGALHDLAQKAETWDRDSSISLFNSAQRAVTDAEERVDALVPLAKGDWARASDFLGKVRGGLVRLRTELEHLIGSVRSATGDPASRRDELKGLWTLLDGAAKDLDGAARQMGVDTRLKAP